MLPPGEFDWDKAENIVPEEKVVCTDVDTGVGRIDAIPEDNGDVVIEVLLWNTDVVKLDDVNAALIVEAWLWEFGAD